MKPEAADRLRALFPIVTFLGGVWLFILSKIDTLMASELVPDAIPCFIYVHIVVTWYLLLGLYLLHRASVEYVVYVDEKVQGREWQVSVYFYQSWFAAMMACVLAMLLSVFACDNVFLFAAAFVVSFGVSMCITSGFDFLYTVKVVTSHLIVITVFGLIYMLAAVAMFSGVDVATDKKVYNANDEITVTVMPTGYMFVPEITHVAYGHDQVLYDLKVGSGVCPRTIRFIPNQVGVHSAYISVNYRLQIFGAVKNKNVRVYVVSNLHD